MAAYDTLRSAIDNYIKTNGNKEITGAILNDILNAMITALGADVRFAGVATPSTNPGNPEGNVVYFASQAGTYSNFGGIVLPLGIHILLWNGTTWTSQTWFAVDNTPTQNSSNLATSGGILQAIVDAVGVERLRAIGAEVTSCSFDGTTKKISFFNSADTTLFQLDATAFVIDGMVSDVTIEDGNLVIKFNTDAGKQDIEIPITEIFNPDNYYTKTQIDNLLTAINSRFSAGYLYKGVATPATNPSTQTEKVFYITTTAGTYPYFLDSNNQPIVVKEGEAILKYDGTSWSLEQYRLTDGGVFDVTAYSGSSFASLDALLSNENLNNIIPVSVRKGGMSIKFVQSSDNKYVQYRCMAQNFTTDVTLWQGVDEEPTAGSDNLVKSGGIYNFVIKDCLPKSLLGINESDFTQNGYYLSDGTFVVSSRKLTDYIEVAEGSEYLISVHQDNDKLSVIAFDSSQNIILDSSVSGSVTRIAYAVATGVRYIRLSASSQLQGVVFIPKTLNLNNIKENTKGVEKNTLRFNSVDIFNGTLNRSETLFYRVKTNIELTKLVLDRIINTGPDGSLRITLKMYEPTHTSTPLNFLDESSQAEISVGYKKFTYSFQDTYLSIEVIFTGERVNANNLNKEIPLENIIFEKDELHPFLSNFLPIEDEIGNILSNNIEVGSLIQWKNGRLDYNDSSYQGWTNSGTHINSGFFKLPAGSYTLKARRAGERAPLLLAFNNDLTFSRIIVNGGSSFSTHNFTLTEDTIVAANCSVGYVSQYGYSLVKKNTGRLDTCVNFSEENGKLYYRGAPIASESSLSTVVADLPVSDGTGIASGYAYIDSTDRTIKVKS